MKLQHCLAALAAASLTALAGAAPVTYTFSGTVATGEGGNILEELRLVISGDTVDVDTADPGRAIISNGLGYVLTIGGTGYTFNDPAGLYVYNRLPDGVIGFGFSSTLDWLLLDTASLGSYELDTDVASVGGTLLDDSQGAIGISGGIVTQLAYDALSNFSFSAEVQDNAVPEPGSFALAGLALAGLVLTRRRA